MSDYWPEEEEAAPPTPFADAIDDPGGVLRDPYGLVTYGVPDGHTLLAHNPWYEDLQMSAMDLLRRRDPVEAERIERLAERRSTEAGHPWVIVDLLD